MNVLLFSQAHRQARGAADRDLIESVQAAGLAGLRVVDISRRDVPVEDQIGAARPQRGDMAVVCGYIPAPGEYEDLHDAAGEFGVDLVNSPAASEQATDFAQWYPLLEEVTPRSVILRDERDVSRVGGELGWPVFIKGAVKSTKEAGWKSCIAGDEDTLRRRLADVDGRPVTMRGALIARQVAPLRQTGRQRSGFPVSREYRVYVLDGEVLACVPYWEQVDPFGKLSTQDQAEVDGLVARTSDRLDARLVCVDVAELESGGWIVVEVGDPQFTGLAHVQRVAYFSRMARHLNGR